MAECGKTYPPAILLGPWKFARTSPNLAKALIRAFYAIIPLRTRRTEETICPLLLPTERRVRRWEFTPLDSHRHHSRMLSRRRLGSIAKLR